MGLYIRDKRDKIKKKREVHQFESVIIFITYIDKDNKYVTCL